MDQALRHAGFKRELLGAIRRGTIGPLFGVPESEAARIGHAVAEALTGLAERVG